MNNAEVIDYATNNTAEDQTMDLSDLFHKDCRPDSYMRMLTALMLLIPISILMN